MARLHLRTSTAMLALAAATILVVPLLSTPVLGSTSGASTTGIAGPVETNLTATKLDLGTLGGYSEAVAVDGSIVVGTSLTASGDTASGEHAFAYDLAAAEPAMLDLGTLGGGYSEAVAVDGTIVVGLSDTATPFFRHAFAYDLAAAEPAMLDLGTLGGADSMAAAVDGTIVVGWSLTAYGEQHAFAYDLAATEPAMLDLGTLGSDSSMAAAVDGTIVVGSSGTASGERHAFAYDLAAAEPAMLDLGTLGGDDSYAAAVDGTIVVGWSWTASGEQHAFAYDLAAAEPAMLDLGTLGGRKNGAAAVDGTIVVGTSWTASGGRRAFAYDLAAPEPAMQNLGTVPGGAATDTSATAIDGDLVIGYWEVRRMGAHKSSAVVYDLGADEPAMLDLGTWNHVSDIDGDVVVGMVPHASNWRATAWVLRETTQPMITFQRFERRVNEGVGRATIRVARSGRTDRAVTVRYRTHSDTAQTGQDFVAASGTLHFARGVTRRSFKVKILNDRRRERPEYLLLRLSRSSSPALLGTPGWSQLRITANDR